VQKQYNAKYLQAIIDLGIPAACTHVLLQCEQQRCKNVVTIDNRMMTCKQNVEEGSGAAAN
jgi:hypothetical protein